MTVLTNMSKTTVQAQYTVLELILWNESGILHLNNKWQYII